MRSSAPLRVKVEKQTKEYVEIVELGLSSVPVKASHCGMLDCV
jgi:hypothetical protein